MKTSKHFISLIIINLLTVISLRAQVKPLQFGEQMPDLELTELYNTTAKKISIGDAKGKIIIIDFWSSWCGSCINGLKKMNALQKKYDKQIMIIPVDYQSKDLVSKFWTKNPITKELTIPTVVSDTTLNKMFPHTSLPHVIWIDQKGRYLNATATEYANEKEIEKMLKGEQVKMVTKVSNSDQDLSKALLAPETNVTRKSFYSAISGIQNDKKPNTIRHIDTINRTFRITVVNQSLLALFGISKSDFKDLDQKRRLITIQDRSKLKHISSTDYISEWDQQNKYCYELVWPLDSSLDIRPAYEKMRSDLNAFFDYHIEIRDSIADCYVLKNLNNGNLKLETSKGASKKLMSVSSFVAILESNDHYPIVLSEIANATHLYLEYNENLTLTFDKLSKYLVEYGIYISKEKRRFPFYFLTDKKKPS